jgi:hypothetical protein
MGRPGEAELCQLGLVPAYYRREVHHLGEPEYSRAPQQAFQVAARERSARRLEARGGYTRGGHEVDLERQSLAGVEQPVDAVRAEHVRDLVRIGDHGRRAQGQHEPSELVNEELRRLEVHVRVDESRYDVPPRGIDDVRPLVLAQPGDPAVRHGHVELQPLPREHREDVSSTDDKVRRLVTASDRDSASERGHALATITPP